MGPLGWSSPGPETEGTEGGEALGTNMAFLHTVLRSRGARDSPTYALGTAPSAGQAQPTSLTASAHEPWRADAFTNVVVADAAVETVRTVLVTGWSPFLRRAGCRESREGQSATCHRAGYGCPQPQAARALLTSHDEAVEGTPQRAVPHERGTVDTVFIDTDIGECQDNVVILHLTPVCGLVVGAWKGTEGYL